MTNDIKQVVDWGKPIEAVHEDGRVSKAVFKPLGDKPMVDIEAIGCGWYVSEDGDVTGEWRIRNVTPAAPEWGPPIPVDGKRPEWLGDDGKQVVAYNRRLSDHWFGMREGGPTFYIRDIEEADDGNGWADVTAIRLPANHPHYAQNAPETYRQGTDGVRTGVEALERYEAFLRRLATGLVGIAEAMVEAKALLPVDPDLVEARAMAARDGVNPMWATACISGAKDDEEDIRFRLEGIKRGRALARGEGW